MIDVGLCDQTLFLMMASAGLDAAIMAGQSPVLKKYLGKAAVAASGLRHWWSYGYPDFHLRAEGEEWRVPFFSCCNIPQYGGPFRLAPAADERDGELDLILFAGRGRWATGGFARDLARGRHLQRADVQARRVTQLRVEGQGTIQIQLDGDVCPFDLPLTIAIRPAALTVLAAPQQHS